MASFWEKTKKAAAEAADATSRGTQRTKLSADISLLERKMRQAKEAFGTAIWDIWGTAASVPIAAVLGSHAQLHLPYLPGSSPNPTRCGTH